MEAADAAVRDAAEAAHMVLKNTKEVKADEA